MDNQRQATLAVLAGFFAGEGCIQLRKSNKHSKSPTLTVEVGNTERFWCEKFKETFGGSTRVRIAKKRPSHLPYHKWYVKDEKAAEVLQELRPYLLGEKAPQLELALKAAAIKTQRPDRGRRGSAGHFTDLELSGLNALMLELEQLRFAAAETKRKSVQNIVRSDSPILEVIPENA